MSQHFKSVNRANVSLARELISQLLWVTRFLLRVLLRRPVIDVLLLMLVLWLIAGFIGRLVMPEPVLQQPAALIESR
jgi:hypothetical protein